MTRTRYLNASAEPETVDLGGARGPVVVPGRGEISVTPDEERSPEFMGRVAARVFVRARVQDEVTGAVAGGAAPTVSPAAEPAAPASMPVVPAEPPLPETAADADAQQQPATSPPTLTTVPAGGGSVAQGGDPPIGAPRAAAARRSPRRAETLVRADIPVTPEE